MSVNFTLQQANRDRQSRSVAAVNASDNMIVPRPLPSLVSRVATRVRNLKDECVAHPYKTVAAALMLGYTLSRKDRIVQKVREIPQMIQNFRDMSTTQKTDVINKGAQLLSSIGSLYFAKRQMEMILGSKIDLTAPERDLSRKARRGQLPPMAGRNDIIDKVFTSLTCTDKPNVVLVGPAGVGKTAIAEGLAMRLESTPKTQLPEALRKAKVIEVKATEFQSGTAFMGSFERKVERFLKDVENSPHLIIFIDEIHMLMNLGSSSTNLRDILKPLLARGKCHIIGATTSNEIEALNRDAAFKRRFQQIDVPEPQGQELKHIVKAAAQRYADKHVCKYTQEALQKAIDESARLPGNNPDKALTLLDQAGAMMNHQFPTNREARIVKPELIAACANKSAGATSRFMDLNGPLTFQRK